MTVRRHHTISILLLTLLFSGNVHGQISPWSKLSVPASPAPDLYGACFLGRDTGFVCGTVGSSGRLYMTTNAGGSWIPIALPGSPISVNDIKILKTSGFGIVVGDDGYVATSTDTGRTWTNRTASLGLVWATTSSAEVNGAWIAGPNIAFVVGNGQTGTGLRLARTSDGGITWQRLSLPTPANNLYSIAFFDSLRGIVSGTGTPPRAARTTNAGLNWTSPDSLGLRGPTSLSFYGLDVLPSSGTGYVAGGKVVSPGSLYPEVRKTTDYGASWSITGLNASYGLTVPANDVIALSSQAVYVAARGGRVLASSDGGTTWRLDSLPQSTGSYDLRKFARLSDKKFYLVGAGGTVLRYEPLPVATFGSDSIVLNVCPGEQTGGSLSIGNIGNGMLVIDSTHIRPSAGSPLAYDVPLPNGVPALGTSSVGIQVRASVSASPGIYRDTLLLFSNDSNYIGANRLRRLLLVTMVNNKGLVAVGPLPANVGRSRVGFSGLATLSGIIRNPYDCATRISSVRFSRGVEFSLQAPMTNRLVPPGGSDSVSIYFVPELFCTRRDTLIVEHDGPGSPLLIPVMGTGTEPGFATDPRDTLDFGNVVVGLPVDRILKIGNSKPGGCLDSTRISAFRLLPSGTDFSSTFTLGAPVYLQPRDELSPIITVNATSTGVKTARVLIDHEILGASVTDTVVLIANAVQPAVTPVRNTIIFAPTDIGGWRDTLAQKFLRNFSGADVRIVSVNVGGANANDFVYRGPTSFPISTGSAQDIPVTFRPSGTGLRSAVLEIKTDIPSTIVINLSGNAARPSIGSRRRQIVFEPTAVNDCRDSVVIRFLVNTSIVPLRIARLRIGGVPPPPVPGDDSLAFSVVAPVIPPDSMTIAPGDSAAIRLSFCPKRPGPHRAQLYVESNADTVLVVQLVGPAQAADVVSVDSVLFQPTRVLTTRDTSITGLIFNNQNGRLDILSVSIEGSDALSFQVQSPAAPFSIEKNRDTAVAIRFRPMRRGRHVATLQINTSQGMFAVVLHGEAIYPFLEIRPENAASLRVRIGTTRRVRIDITNAGDDSSRIEGATIGGSPAFTNVSTGPFPARLLPGESIPLFVDFAPEALCAHDANVELQGEGISGIYGMADTTVQLVGIGTAPLVSSRRDEISFGTILLNSVSDSTLPDFLGNTDFSSSTSSCLDSTHIDSLVIERPSAASFEILMPADPTSPQPLGGERFLPLVIRFTPRTNGLHTARLVAYFDGSEDSATTIQLIGASTALPLRYGPEPEMLSIDFGRVPLDSKRDSIFTATNISESPIVIDSVTLPSGNNFSFTSLPAFPLVMQPGTPVQFGVRFAPQTSVGVRSVTVAFHGESVVDTSFGLFGTAIASRLSSRVDTLDFGLRAPGSSTDSTVTLANEPGGTVTTVQLLDTAHIDRAMIVEGGADFQVVAFPSLVAPGDTDLVTVRFRAIGTRGERRGVLRVFHNMHGVDPDRRVDSLDVILRGSVDGPAVPVRISLGDDIDTEPGMHITTPVILEGNIDSLAITQFTTTLSYPRKLLRPVMAHGSSNGISASIGTTVNSLNGSGMVEVTISSGGSLSGDTVAVVEWLVLLGDLLEGDVRTDSIVVAGRDDIAFLPDSATISIEKYCNAARRLIRFDSLLTFSGKPNPSAGTMMILYDIPAIMDVQVSLYDPLGREVKRFADGELQPGRYSDQLDIQLLDNGVYYCVLRAGRFTRSFTIHVLR